MGVIGSMGSRVQNCWRLSVGRSVLREEGRWVSQGRAETLTLVRRLFHSVRSVSLEACVVETSEPLYGQKFLRDGSMHLGNSNKW